MYLYIEGWHETCSEDFKDCQDSRCQQHSMGVHAGRLLYLRRMLRMHTPCRMLRSVDGYLQE